MDRKMDTPTPSFVHPGSRSFSESQNGGEISRYAYSRFNVTVDIEDGRKIIYNTQSNVLSVLDQPEAAFYCGLLNKSIGELSQAELEILDNLLINNFIVPADIDELALLEECYLGARHSPETLIFTITPTLNCNFSCHYCYQGTIKDRLIMSSETQEETIHFIRQKAHPDYGVRQLSVTWFGGEPLLGLPAIKNISDRTIAWCDQHKISYSAMAVTNGFLLNHKTAGELYVRRVRTIQITLDGNRDTHDQIRFLKNSKSPTFDRIVGNIAEYSADYPIHTTIRVNMDVQNVDSIHKLIEQLAQAGLGYKNVSMYFAPLVSSTSACRSVCDDTLTLENFSQKEFELYQAAMQAGFIRSSLPPRFMGICGATRPGGFVIVANGDIHKCWETVSFPELRTGHVVDTPSREDLANDSRWKNWSPFNESSCRDCSILPNCVGFCSYKFLYKDEFAGNAGQLPCPSLRFNIKERILHYAKSNHML
jgi:uncharacterized protein